MSIIAISDNAKLRPAMAAVQCDSLQGDFADLRRCFARGRDNAK
jgi:hypothetical protein